MIISASRRTDIPAFYSEWFLNRLKEGYVLVRNPLNIHQVSKIKLTPDVVDFIVFWTKNPEDMINRLDELKNYDYYFQFTVTSYDTDIEVNVPSKGKNIISTFKKLSDKIGKQKVIWRYDPILLSEKYSIDYHGENFEKLAERLSDYTDRCTISFLDLYKKTERNLKGAGVEPFDEEKMRKVAKNISEIAKGYNILIDTCSEKIDLKEFGITHANCIDAKLMKKLTNYEFGVSKDKNQRLECGCVESIDIGAYNTCKNCCKYCYANFSQNQVEVNSALHDFKSEILCGQVDASADIIKERKVKSVRQELNRQSQLSLEL